MDKYDSHIAELTANSHLTVQVNKPIHMIYPRSIS